MFNVKNLVFKKVKWLVEEEYTGDKKSVFNFFCSN